MLHARNGSYLQMSAGMHILNSTGRGYHMPHFDAVQRGHRLDGGVAPLLFTCRKARLGTSLPRRRES